MRKVYVLEIEDYYAGEQNNNVLLFSSYKKAIKSLKELRDDFFKNYDIDYYIVDDDREYSFDCYRKGCYNTDRYCLFIHEQELL